MKYVTRGTGNTLTFKLNNTPINTFSGTYIFNCKHIQTDNILNLTLTDISLTPNVYQKFYISSGQSLNFESGQYEVQIFDASASTKLITEEYFTVYSDKNASPIIFMSGAGQDIIYGITGYTTIPDVPQNFNAILLPVGNKIQLNWNMGLPNAMYFDLWRKKTSGGTYFSLNSTIQSLIYFDDFLEYSTEYFYKIRAINNIGFSAFTPEISITTADFTGQTGQTIIHIKGSGETIVTNISGNSWVIYSPVIPPVILIGSGLTHTHNVSGNIWTIFSTGNTGQTGGSIYYTGATPSAIAVGGILAGETLTGKTFTELFEDLLVPTLFPMIVAPSSTMTRYISTNALYEINETLSIEFEQDFNRGSINPSYGTNGFRSGVPKAYYYNGTGLPLWVLSNAMSDAQVINNYHVLIGTNSWNGHVQYYGGQQPKDSKGNNYNTPLPSGVTSVQYCTLEGVYPIFATTVTISTLTKQPLVSMINGNNFIYSVVAETGGMGGKQTFELADTWLTARPITGIQTFNTVSQSWEYQGGNAATSLTYWTQSFDSQTIQGNLIGYTKFTYNGVDRASVQIKIILT